MITDPVELRKVIFLIYIFLVLILALSIVSITVTSYLYTETNENKRDKLLKTAQSVNVIPLGLVGCIILLLMYVQDII